MGRGTGVAPGTRSSPEPVPTPVSMQAEIRRRIDPEIIQERAEPLGAIGEPGARRSRSAPRRCAGGSGGSRCDTPRPGLGAVLVVAAAQRLADLRTASLSSSAWALELPRFGESELLSQLLTPPTPRGERHREFLSRSVRIPSEGWDAESCVG